ncbi:hypothetical protein MTR67_039760 [Solanum verrucosum]|uniref:Uncharacterized protein n=1 Tax=Solanum verrucosum TaxID=315347 RepID=A0AAF0UHG0_SOLVR|nr:hypothetical protein MTR67_039760 [Solanum verrucosum]
MWVYICMDSKEWPREASLSVTSRKHAFKNVPIHILKFLNELFLYLMSIFPANFIPVIKKLLQLMLVSIPN